METAAQGILTRDEMESRRLLAAQDLQNGLSQSKVARKFGVSRTTASRWHRALNGTGVEALRKRRATGTSQAASMPVVNSMEIAEIYKAGAFAGNRVRHGPLDHDAFRGGDSYALRDSIRPGPCGEDHASVRVAGSRPDMVAATVIPMEPTHISIAS